MKANRRSFLGAGLAAIGSISFALPEAEAQLVYRRTDWNMAEFDKLVHTTAHYKQAWDVKAVGDGKFLNGMKNSLNGLQFGFGVPADGIRLAAALHGPANMLNFSDAMWAKYRLGEILEVKDPKSGKAATRNPYLAKGPNTATDVEDPKSVHQDWSIEALQARGVVFLSCHNATQEVVRAMVAPKFPDMKVDEIVHDLQSNLISGAQIMPAMVAALCVLQTAGRFTYVAG